MTAKTKKQPFTTFRFERDPGNTKNHRLYAVEKTEYGTLLFFLENEVLEAKHLFHDTHKSISSDGPLMSSGNQAERLFAVLNESYFMLPDDLQAEDVFMLRLWSVKGLKRCLCTYFNKNNILSMPATVENLPECPQETVIARQLAESDLHHYEIQTKDDQSWLVELLEPRPYTDQEQKRIHGHDNITDTQTAPGELERLRAFAKQGKAAAIKSLTDAFQDLSHDSIHVGWLHAKGIPWTEIKRRTGFSQGKVQNLKNEFYSVTGWPKGDRRKGGGIGKTYQLDENRDAGTI